MSVESIQAARRMTKKHEEDCITLLSKDPNWLYVYWDLSEDKKNSFINDFGRELWEKSTPVLKITNITKNEYFYTRINDFSDNWYINVPDSNCQYMIEFGRKVSEHFFISMFSSNCSYTPSNNISPNLSTYFINYNYLKNNVLEMGSEERNYLNNFGESSSNLYNLDVGDFSK